MAKRTLVHPVLFSKHFGISPGVLAKAGLLDPILNSDTRLFIDPLLIVKSQNPLIRAKGRATLEQGLTNVVGLIDMSQQESDAPWKGAYKALNLSERSETGLGYGGASTTGSSRPPELRHKILRTAKEIITLGEKNPAMIPLMGLFEEGVGPDTLSDMTTNFLLPVLCEITENFARDNKLPLSEFGATYDQRHLPENPFTPGKPVILVPRDILRDLPLATDWADVSKVIMEIDEIRDAVNVMFGGIIAGTVKEKKEQIRKAAFESPHNLRAVIDAVSLASESYDEKADLDGLYQFRDALYADPTKFKGMLRPATVKTNDALIALVLQMIDQFKGLVEANNMWELLWYGDVPRHERASQLLFFAICTVMCAINGIDISPETNSGGGPVDFKFSTGFHGRVLVEMKLSKGTVESGYKKQLEAYKAAAQTRLGIFVIIDVGGMGRKLSKIRKAKSEAEARGEHTSEIIVINAMRQMSASKRR
jgi:hypothetical protein